MNKYSLIELLTAYKENKEYISAYLNKDTIEFYDSDFDNKKFSKDGKKILGMTLGFFLFILILNVLIWIWALYVLIKFWDNLPIWAKIIGVIGVLPIIPGGCIVTLVVVYAVKK